MRNDSASSPTPELKKGSVEQLLLCVLAQPFMAKYRAKLRGATPLPIRTSAFTLIGITGDVAAGKLAVTFESGTVTTMYVALLKAKTGWAIVEILTDKDLLSSMFPLPPRVPGPQK